jgi:hypothetical protein
VLSLALIFPAVDPHMSALYRKVTDSRMAHGGTNTATVCRWIALVGGWRHSKSQRHLPWHIKRALKLQMKSANPTQTSHSPLLIFNYYAYMCALAVSTTDARHQSTVRTLICRVVVRDADTLLQVAPVAAKRTMKCSTCGSHDPPAVHVCPGPTGPSGK